MLATLYVAKKYLVGHLARSCVAYLETGLSARNACVLLAQSRLFQEPGLEQRCWEVIDAQVSSSLSDSSIFIKRVQFNFFKVVRMWNFGFSFVGSAWPAPGTLFPNDLFPSLYVLDSSARLHLIW